MKNELRVPIPNDEAWRPSRIFHDTKTDTEKYDQAINALIHAKTPVWAGAKGFSLSYEECKRRAIINKGYESITGLDRLHVQLGELLQTAHVITMTSKQVVALPDMDPSDSSEFVRSVQLPFDPLFLDFTADDHVPSIESEMSITRRIQILGSLIHSSPLDDGVVFITPIFYYGHEAHRLTPISLGSIAVNRTDDPNRKFQFMIGSHHQFVQVEDKHLDMLILLADSPAFRKDNGRQLMDEYESIILEASTRVIAALYLFEAANIEIVDAPLERRLKKRQEKRGWNIPLTIRVDRPAKRFVRGNGDHDHAEVDWQYQWEVTGCYHHITKGNAVRCTVCEGNETEDLVCPRCNGTGLDPDKTKPCSRIDIKTGKKTCPNGCRRIWHKEHVKGPDDKPLVIKTRKIRT